MICWCLERVEAVDFTSEYLLVLPSKRPDRPNTETFHQYKKKHKESLHLLYFQVLIKMYE